MLERYISEEPNVALAGESKDKNEVSEHSTHQ